MSDKIINKVDEILKIKNENFNADVSKIDRIVYGLYDLTEGEIKIVENWK